MPQDCAAKGQRVLVTTLTKKMAEALTEYLHEAGVRVRYMHSDVDTLERIEIIRDLRLGVFDVLVGINLLREGLDIPECALVAVLDADKEGYLRSRTSLIQTIGRAARHLDGRVVLYADRMTDSSEHGDRRDQPPPREAAGLQRRAWHHAGKRAQAASPTSSTASTSAITSRSVPARSGDALPGQQSEGRVSPISKNACARPPPISNSRRRRGCATRSAGSSSSISASRPKPWAAPAAVPPRPARTQLRRQAGQPRGRRRRGLSRI